jgi:3-carboxy-cis,cis-muconate cycloisomerase
MNGGMGRLLDPLFTTPEMAAVLDDRARLQAMLDFEAGLARAEARLGLIPAEAEAPIGAACRAERFDLDALGAATALAGNPAIPLVKALTLAVAGSTGAPPART